MRPVCGLLGVGLERAGLAVDVGDADLALPCAAAGSGTMSAAAASEANSAPEKGPR